jgi:cyclopropane fatty-acyl-phospholipid synthase-like methyltransferase
VNAHEREVRIPVGTLNDQDLFFEVLATYEMVVRENLMDHRGVYATLRQVLLTDAPRPFAFLDLACGSAAASVGALTGTGISRYIGIDISEPSLALAARHLQALPCLVELRCDDFMAAVERWGEPVDVVWIGMSLHHLEAPQKLAFMRRISKILPDDGLFMIWEPTCQEGEDRAGWLDRFLTLRSAWSVVSDEQFEAFNSHSRASDFPETASRWLEMGREAGFSRAEELYTMHNRRGRVYRYRH